MNEKNLIINPKNGLCNQLMSISKGIILGLITNRNVIFTTFQLDYKDFENVCNFDLIIDINHIQNKLIENNINIKILSNRNIESTKIYLNSNEDICNIKDFIPYLLLDINKDIDNLNVGCPISCNIPNEYLYIDKYINDNIKFTNYYINIANDIKSKLKLDNYSSVHLRLEDDALNFMKELNNNLTIEKINNVYIKKYIEQLDILNKISNNKIYVCTSLCMNENLNNQLYKDLKQIYNIVDKNDIINISNNDCREIYGIIDYIIAQDSLYFIGCDWSSFSIYLYNIHKNNGKDGKLINIWETLKYI